VDRQDIDFALAARAGRAGCWISLGTDSHALEELAWMDIARGHLALAAITAPRVLNHLRREQLGDWLRAKRERVRTPA
jgi:histidinol phosphatase-like PHP family hydrolase